MKYDAIVLAGGKGKRLDLGYNKVFYKMDNQKTIFENACEPFLKDDDCQKIIVVVSKEDEKYIKKEDKIIFTVNGKERFNSVYNGLKEVNSEYVMIHDGARPYITDEDIKHLKDILLNEDACMLGLKAKDTIKEVVDGYITNTLDRNKIYMAQTPQCFKSKLIKDAYSKAMRDSGSFTDDASVFEKYYDIKIKMVDSSNANNKITFIHDLK